MSDVPAVIIFDGGKTELLANVVAQVYAYLLQHPFNDLWGLPSMWNCAAWRPPSSGGNGMNKEPRLRFTEEERADPALEKPIRKAEKAAAKADKAQAKIPKRKVKQTAVDPDTGQSNHQAGAGG